jgi:DNA-binding MarR family transcriptional regulator
MMNQNPTAGDARVNPASLTERWAELADLVLSISREIQFRGYTSPEAISLSIPEGTVMRYLHRHPGVPPSQIAEATGLQRTNVSSTLRSLETKGLIERRDYPEDRRGVRIYPTPLGTSNYALVRQEWASLLSAAAEQADSLVPTLELLARIEEGLVAMRQGS